jgi:hypothetical protein
VKPLSPGLRACLYRLQGVRSCLELALHEAELEARLPGGHAGVAEGLARLKTTLFFFAGSVVEWLKGEDLSEPKNSAKEATAVSSEVPP